MFPSLELNIFGLEPDQQYNVYVDIAMCGKNMWKFDRTWKPAVVASAEAIENDASGRIYLHPDSPKPGSFWMKNDISFYKLKLTNNRQSSKDQMLLTSMHRYIPRVHISPVDDAKNIKTFVFEETKFIAVTAYQNSDVTQLKIDKNPFAKGFRESVEKHVEAKTEQMKYPNKPELTSTRPVTPPSHSLAPTVPGSSLTSHKTPLHANTALYNLSNQLHSTSTPKFTEAYPNNQLLYATNQSSYYPPQHTLNSYQMVSPSSYTYQAPVRSNKRSYDSIESYEDADTAPHSPKYPCYNHGTWNNSADSGYYQDTSRTCNHLTSTSSSSLSTSFYPYNNTYDYSLNENSNSYGYYPTTYAQSQQHQTLNTQNNSY